METYSLPKTLLLATVALLGACLATAASALTLSVVGASLVDVGAGPVSFTVDIIADEDLAVGSTDINFNWDVAGIEATAATSTVLSGFWANIDNPARQVRTASASLGENIPAGTPLMTITMLAEPGDEGLYSLFITDADGLPPDDVAGPVPPVPPVSIPYISVALSVEVIPEPCTDGLDNDCDGIPDALDNCLDIANGPSAGICYIAGVQMDTDGDGYGNPCDGDLNNDGPVNSSDQILLNGDLTTGNSTPGSGSDMNCDGVVNSTDQVMLNAQLAQGFPGP